MKNLYRITDKNGNFLCFQVETTEKKAVQTAKMYGFKYASNAEFISQDY